MLIFNRIVFLVVSLPIICTVLVFDNSLRHLQHRQHFNDLQKLEGALKLVGSQKKFEGNVEIFHSGQWGGICDDEWDKNEADIVCKQLGFDFGEATTNSRFGPSRRHYWMDDIFCNGDEIQLNKCRFNGWGHSDCLASEAAGVICHYNSISSDLTNEYLVPLNAIQAIRLRYGRNPREGIVQVQYPNGKWHIICADSWSILEAMVICRQLSLGYATHAIHTKAFSENLTQSSLVGIKCMGNENFLQECYYDHNRIGECTGNSAAAVYCSPKMADLQLDYYELMKSVYVEIRPLSQLKCAMEENCVASEAYKIQQLYKENWTYFSRKLLRFTTTAKNIGNADFRPALPKQLWEWHLCHRHYHSMEIFATFDIYDMNGHKKAQGHKASFCLEDNQCDNGIVPNYRCANFGDQGISVNCTDVYKHTIDCQWIDITELPENTYILKVAINPEFKVPEISFENNAAICKFTYNGTSAVVENCAITRP